MRELVDELRGKDYIVRIEKLAKEMNCCEKTIRNYVDACDDLECHDGFIFVRHTTNDKVK